jgi:hypothetical protein
MKIETDLDDMFEDFMHRVNPTVREQSSQYRESRRVFFAGITAMFSLLMQTTSLPEDGALKVIADIEQQLDDFQKRIGFNV